MSGRVVIPIHDEKGELVAYAGRAIDDSEPRYKLPAGFHKSQVVYNLQRVEAQRSCCGGGRLLRLYEGCASRILSGGVDG